MRLGGFEPATDGLEGQPCLAQPGGLVVGCATRGPAPDGRGDERRTATAPLLALFGFTCLAEAFRRQTPATPRWLDGGYHSSLRAIEPRKRWLGPRRPVNLVAYARLSRPATASADPSVVIQSGKSIGCLWSAGSGDEYVKPSVRRSKSARAAVRRAAISPRRPPGSTARSRETSDPRVAAAGALHHRTRTARGASSRCETARTTPHPRRR